MRAHNSLLKASLPLFAGQGGFFFAPPAFAAGILAAAAFASDRRAPGAVFVFAAGPLTAGADFFTAIPENFVLFPIRVKEKAGKGQGLF
jgi:hypothetical protein